MSALSLDALFTALTHNTDESSALGKQCYTTLVQALYSLLEQDRTLSIPQSLFSATILPMCPVFTPKSAKAIAKVLLDSMAQDQTTKEIKTVPLAMDLLS